MAQGDTIKVDYEEGKEQLSFSSEKSKDGAPKGASDELPETSEPNATDPKATE